MTGSTSVCLDLVVHFGPPADGTSGRLVHEGGHGIRQIIIVCYHPHIAGTSPRPKPQDPSGSILVCEFDGRVYLVKRKSNANLRPPWNLMREDDCVEERHTRMIALKSHFEALHSTCAGQPSPWSRAYINQCMSSWRSEQAEHGLL